MTIIYLNQRRKIPRNPIKPTKEPHFISGGGGMVFILAWISGMLTIMSFAATLQAMVNMLSWVYPGIAWVITIILFIIAGQKAEKLWERMID